MNAHQNLPEESIVAAVLGEQEIVSVLYSYSYLTDDPESHNFWPIVEESDSLPLYRVTPDISGQRSSTLLPLKLVSVHSR